MFMIQNFISAEIEETSSRNSGEQAQMHKDFR
jgi:hypothetical protein